MIPCIKSTVVSLQNNSGVIFVLGEGQTIYFTSLSYFCNSTNNVQKAIIYCSACCRKVSLQKDKPSQKPYQKTIKNYGCEAKYCTSPMQDFYHGAVCKAMLNKTVRFPGFLQVIKCCDLMIKYARVSAFSHMMDFDHNYRNYFSSGSSQKDMFYNYFLSNKNENQLRYYCSETCGLVLTSLCY